MKRMAFSQLLVLFSVSFLSAQQAAVATAMPAVSLSLDGASELSLSAAVTGDIGDARALASKAMINMEVAPSAVSLPGLSLSGGSREALVLRPAAAKPPAVMPALAVSGEKQAKGGGGWLEAIKDSMGIGFKKEDGAFKTFGKALMAPITEPIYYGVVGAVACGIAGSFIPVLGTGAGLVVGAAAGAVYGLGHGIVDLVIGIGYGIGKLFKGQF